MSENHFFWPKSIIFQPISMKLSKNVENGKTQILEYFGRNWPPLWRHQRVKNPKMSFLDLIRTFFNQSLLINLAKLLRMKNANFGVFFTNLTPSMTSSGVQNVQKSPFLTEIGHFSTNLNKTCQKCWECKNTNFGVFLPKLAPSMTSSGGQKIHKMSFWPLFGHFSTNLYETWQSC